MNRFCRCVILLTCGAIAGSGCRTEGGGATIPPVLPSDITLSIDELPDEGANDFKAKDIRQGNLSGVIAFNRTIRTATAVLNGFHLIAARALSVGEQIMSDITDVENPIVEGTIIIQGESVAYHADFSAFDIDGDGQADGSGRADTEPVALRLWVDRGDGFARFLCALVQTRPTETNLGAGKMFIHPAAVNDDAVDTLQIYVQYDRTDDAHKWNEAVIQGKVRDHFVMSGGRHRVDVRTDDEDMIEKTVRSTSNFTDNSFGFEHFQSALHYQLGGNSLLMSAESTGGTAQVGFENICVTIDDQVTLNDGSCDAFDPQDFSFLDPTNDGEADFPADFPEQPAA